MSFQRLGLISKQLDTKYSLCDGDIYSRCIECFPLFKSNNNEECTATTAFLAFTLGFSTFVFYLTFRKTFSASKAAKKAGIPNSLHSLLLQDGECRPMCMDLFSQRFTGLFYYL